MGDALMSRGLLSVIQCANTRKIMRAALDGGFEWIGYTKSGHVEISWPATGQLLHCATTPSDPNSWKAFARQVESVGGITVWHKGNKKRSRKSTRSAVDPQVEASRRRYAAEMAASEAARAAEVDRERRRVAAARRAADDDRRRRDVESLMRPGACR